MRLTELMLPYADPTLPVLRNPAGAPEAFRFADAPPVVVRQVLAVVPSVAASRPHGQPPAQWILEIGGRFGGLLCGAVNAAYGAFRVDAICLPAVAVPAVAQLLASAWPGQDEAALAEAWAAWDSTVPLWTGTGLDLPTPVPGAAVFSLWWD